jgi:TatD DNase family protein
MSAELIDTHAHLDDEKFQGDLSAVLERARNAGVTRIVTIATTASSSATCIGLAEQHPMLAATVGLQPNNLAQEPADAWDQVASLVNKPKVVAVGETGLDRHWDDTPFAQQEDYFARHLELARKHNLAVVIHCREAEADVVRMLKEDYNRHGPVRGVMHSFTGNLATAQACLDMGLFISFAGMVTYKNAQNLRDVAAKVPLDRMLVETDSPYLAPEPVRGQRNEPGHVIHTAKCLAGVLGLDLETFAQQTTRNARTLLQL